MLVALTWFIASLALGALVTWYARQFACAHDWLDEPNERSFHDEPVPRIGGTGILFPVLLTVLALLFLGGSSSWLWLAPLLPSLMVALVSLVDDRIELSRLTRFSSHLIFAVILLWLMKPWWVEAPLPFLGTGIPVVACGLLLLLWVVGLTNAYNFMDGIDGIASLQGAVAIFGWLTIFAVAVVPGAAADAQTLLLLSLMGGLLGFLVLNWAPASIFMGDSGSTFCGFYLAAMPFAATAMGLPFDRALEAGVLFVWPFILDAGITFIRRLVRREPVFEAHRSHLYQVLAGTFPSRQTGHRATSLLFALLSLVGIGLYWTEGPLWAKLAVLGWLWIALVVWTYGIRVKSGPAAEQSVPTQAGLYGEEMEPDFPDTGVMPFDIYLSPPDITDAEHRRLTEALQSGFIAPVGPQVNAFERGLADYLGMEELIALSSGTAAIHLGLRALGVGPGDSVICPDLTFIASVNPVRYLGAEPVLVDVQRETWALDPDLVREAIRSLKAEGRTVKAMVIVHAFGIPAPITRLMEVAREEGVLVLEDCAGAFGARNGNQAVGSHGDAAAYSFNGNKVLTTSGGGALYVKDPEMRPAARSWANQGKRAGAVGYQHETLGYNYKLSNICAAIGLAQLETVQGRLARKKAIFEAYRTRFAGFPEISYMPEPEYGGNNYWLSCIGLETRTDAEDLVSSLRKQRIEASPMWKPMHLQSLNRDLKVFGGSISEEIHRRFLSLPSGSSLSDRDLDRVVRLVGKHLQVASR